MAQYESSTITGEATNSPNPSLEEEYAALQKEGIIDPEGDTPGEDPNAQGGAEDGSAGGAEDGTPSVPEKFLNEDGTVNTEALLKSYQELEKRQSKGDDEYDDDVSEHEYAPATEEERAAAEEATEAAGLDLNEVSQEWFENNGVLSDDTYDALDEAGYPREMVDIYIEGLTSRTSNTINAAYEVSGGEEGYEAMAEWASQNLSQEEINAYDAVVNGSNKAAVVMAVRGLKAQYDAAMSKDSSEEPEEVISAKGGRTRGDTYEDMAQYMADMDDPRYETSEAFRAKVAAKLGRSNIM